MLTKMTNVTNKNTYVVPFGVYDPQSREIGTQVCVYEYDVVPSESNSGYTELITGHYFVCNVHSSRGGKEYGATQREHRFLTKQEREEYISKRLINGRQYATKKFG